jgi:hypothetical protein
MEICRKRNLKFPLAYLLNRDGCYEDAISTFMEVIETIDIKYKFISHDDVPTFKQSMNLIDQIKREPLRKFDKILLICLQTCKDYSLTLSEER